MPIGHHLCAMAAPLTVRLLPEPDLHDLLAATLERVNKACNGARTRALERGVPGRAALQIGRASCRERVYVLV